MCPFQAFAVIGTLNFLRVIVSFIPFATRALGESKVSFERMKVGKDSRMSVLKTGSGGYPETWNTEFPSVGNCNFHYSARIKIMM